MRWWWPGLVCLCYVLLRLWSFHDVFGTPAVRYRDTHDYLSVASLPLASREFWTHWKSPGLPLLYKALPGSAADGAVFAQFCIATASWMVLALTVASGFRRRPVQVAGLVVVLAFSLTPLIAQWDGQLLTESLSDSLTALLVAAAIALVRSPGAIRLALVVLAALGATLTRGTNAYLALLLLLPLGAELVHGGRRRLGLTLVTTTVLIFALEIWSYNVRRWETPMQAVIAGRVLTVPSALSYFEARGMPTRPNLRELLLLTRTPPGLLDNSAVLAYFRPWFHDRARSTYLGYLLSHPGVSLAEPLRNLDVLLAPPRPAPTGLDAFRPQGYRDALPGWAIKVLYPENGWVVLALMVAAAAMVVWSWWGGRVQENWLVPVLGLLSAVALAVIVWTGDPTGLDRHSLVVGLMARLSVILLALLFIDAIPPRGPRSLAPAGSVAAA